MSAYFVDTWFFIAFMHQADPQHRTTKRLAHSLSDAVMVTHDAVLTELLTFFAGYGSFWRTTAAALVRNVLINPQYKVYPMTRELFQEALTLYERRLDKEYSLVDCISMRIMMQHGITHVLTNDHHFEQEGFFLVNE